MGTDLIQGAASEIPTQKHFDEVAALLRTEDLDQAVRVSTDLARHAVWLDGYAECRVDELILHNVASIKPLLSRL